MRRGQLTQCREEKMRWDDDFFFLVLNGVLLHFAVTSSVTASRELGGGWSYAGEGGEVVGGLVWDVFHCTRFSDFVKVVVQVS